MIIVGNVNSVDWNGLLECIVLYGIETFGSFIGILISLRLSTPFQVSIPPEALHDPVCRISSPNSHSL